MLKPKTVKSIQYIVYAISLILPVALVMNNFFHSSETIVLANDQLPTVTPSVTPVPTGQKEQEKAVGGSNIPTNITVKVSHYWPALGGTNCLTFKDGKCMSKMANGMNWEDGVDWAIACPRELKFGTKIKILGKVWTCADRGSKITKTATGAYWVDQLTDKTTIGYGSEVSAQIIYQP